MRLILFTLVLCVSIFTGTKARAEKLVHPNPKCPLVLEDIGLGLPEDLPVLISGKNNGAGGIAAEIDRIQRMSAATEEQWDDEELFAPVALELNFPISDINHAYRILLRVVSVMNHPEERLERPTANMDRLSMGWGSMMGCFNAYLIDANNEYVPFPEIYPGARRPHEGSVKGPYRVTISLDMLSKYDALQLLRALRFD